MEALLSILKQSESEGVVGVCSSFLAVFDFDCIEFWVCW